MENNKRIDSKTNLGILMLAIGMFVVGTVELVFAGVLKLISLTSEFRSQLRDSS